MFSAAPPRVLRGPDTSQWTALRWENRRRGPSSLTAHEGHVFGECAANRVLERNERVCVWVMGCPRGQPRNGWCYHNMSFLSTLLCKGLLYVSIALCSILWLLPSPLCFSVAAFKGLRWITAFTRTDAVHCSGFLAFCATIRLPHWCALWLDSDGEEGWGGVNYRLSTLRADTANTGRKYH